MGSNPPLDRLLLLLASVLPALALAACGGSGGSSSTVSVDPAIAQDVHAEATARSAQTAMETYAVDHGGRYEGANVDALVRIEPTLRGEPLRVSSTRSTYGIAAQSESGTFFAVARRARGGLRFKCNAPRKGDCPRGGNWER